MATEAASLYISLSALTTEYIASLDRAMVKSEEFEAKQKELAKPTVLGPVVGGGGAAAGGEAAATERHSGALAALGGAAGMAATGLAVAGAATLGLAGVSLMAAGNFQQLTTQLVTGAGEAPAQLEMVRQGLMAMAPQVGITATELAKGMYNIESAGYHGQAGLDVLKAAAQGAAVGGADMATVADGLTSAMNSYRGSGLSATQMTNDLVASVAAGKMHMQDLTSSLGMVLPAASTAGVSLQQATAAIATMTGEGTPAADAATYLRQTLLMMENPSAKAQKALSDVGLSAGDLHDSLADPNRGLSGTLQTISDDLAKKFGYGSQEYIAHLADVVGGTKSMQAALELTGPNMATFKANVASIGGATADTSGQVKGFSTVQGDFNFKMDAAKASLENAAIAIGDKLLPAAGALADWFVNDGLPGLQAFGGWMGDNVIPILEQFGGWFMNSGLPVIKQFGQWIETNLIPPAIKIGQFLLAVGEIIVTKLGPPMEHLATVIGPPLAKLFGFIGDNINLLLPVIDLLTTALGTIIDVVATVVGTVSTAVSGFVDSVRNNINVVAQFFQDLPGRIVGALSGAGAWLKNTGGDLIGGLWTGITNKVVDLWAWFASIPSIIGQFFSGIGSWLYNAGRALLQGFWDGISSKFSDIKNGLGDFLGGVRNLLPFSPAKEGPFSGGGWTLYAGQALMDGFSEGITSRRGSVAGSLTGVLGGMSFGAVSGGATMGALGAYGGGGTTTMNITFNVSGASDPATTARAIRDQLILLAKQSGVTSLLGQYA